MVRKLSKKVYFLQFCAYLSKKSESVETIHIYASESSHYTLPENGMVYRVPSQRYEIVAFKISKKMLTQLKFNKILQFQILLSPKH